MKKNRYLPITALSLALFLGGCSTSASSAPEKPVEIVIWTYYNGDQLAAFENLVSEFNETIGKEKGIFVVSRSQGSVADMEANILAAVQGKVGAEEIPNIFASYTAAAYTIDQMGHVVNLADYLTPEERAIYVEDYLKEGDFSENGEMKIFPVAKSTEVLLINKTDWDVFASETGASYSDLSTLESLAETARIYYEWTDARTPDIKNDGKALFGRDSMANYALIGAMQLGCEIFHVENGAVNFQFDQQTARRLWDCYYIPFIKGYFAANGPFRSDDILTGDIICYVGSSAGAYYFPDAVSHTDTDTYPIEMDVLPAPQFADGEPYAVQQGAGLVVTNGEEAEIKASVEFLKWFTNDERNIRFSTASGYMPVTKTANDRDIILSSTENINPKVAQTLSAATDTVQHSRLYISKPFDTAIQARDVLEYAIRDLAKTDRQTVAERLAAGQELTEASAEFCSDEYFLAWYENTLQKLKQHE